MDELNDPAFVRKLTTGDAVAFSTLCNSLNRKLSEFIVREIGLSYYDAEEITSSVLYKLHSAIRDYEPRPDAKLTTWIFRIAKNAAIDRKRQLTLQPIFDNIDVVLPPKSAKREEGTALAGELRFDAGILDESNVVDSPKMHPYRVAFDNLSEREKDILRMRNVMDYSEISIVEGEEIGALRTRHSRALKRLRDLSQNGED